MSRAARLRAVVVVVVTTMAIFFCFTNVARADEKQQCVAASEKAQQLKNAGKLSDARDQLVICGRAECPKLIAQDCTEWMKEVLAIVPSVVPGAKDGRGRDVVDVKVSIDGKTVAETLDGKALLVDPGVHTFRFETKGMPAIEEQVVIRQGEKNRILTVTFVAPSDKTSPPPPPPKEEKSSPPIAAYVTGGLGILALGAALYIDLDANSDAKTLRETCAPRCEQSQVDDVENRYVIAGVTAGIGGAALIAGIILFFTHSSSGTKPTSAPFFPNPRRLTYGVGATTATAGFTF